MHIRGYGVHLLPSTDLDSRAAFQRRFLKIERVVSALPVAQLPPGKLVKVFLLLQDRAIPLHHVTLKWFATYSH